VEKEQERSTFMRWLTQNRRGDWRRVFMGKNLPENGPTKRVQPADLEFEDMGNGKTDEQNNNEDSKERE